MTFDKLNKILQKNKISKNVKFMSDSGWECCATEMNGIYYNKKENIIIFTQEFSESESYSKNKEYKKLKE